MTDQTHAKVQARHLKRSAYLYVRHNSEIGIIANPLRIRW